MAYSFREALGAFRRSPLLTALSIAMIGLSLLVVGLFAIAAYNIRRVLERVEERVEIIAFISDNSDFTQVMAAKAEIERLPTVRRVTYVSREQALEIAKKEVPEFQ